MKQALFSLFFFCALCFSMHAQISKAKEKFQKRNATQLINFTTTNLKSASFSNQFFQDLGLSSADDLKVHKRIKGLNNWQRIRMKQYYKGLPVVGSSYVLHERNGLVQKASGDLLPYISLSSEPGFDTNTAKSAAKQYANTDMLSQVNGKARILPDWDFDEVELVVMDKAYPEFSGAYTLAYHVIVSKYDVPNQYRKSFYIDANTSDLLTSVSEIAHESVEGLANTLYYGEQKITTDSLSPSEFVLRDYTRGNGIITLNSTLSDFEDEDNFWNDLNNNEIVGTDVHYCASAFHDYLSDNFNWMGLDGEGAELRSRVYGTEGSFVNSTWNGSFATFFNGDCENIGPLTTLEIVGHEFTHGFIEFSSDLIYQGESGALNESISDILGKALEFAYDADNADWLIGSKILLADNNGHIRDMANPKAKFSPDYYGGDFWVLGTQDNGGVHSNSGILNFWFHILTEGKEGINEVGDAYAVEAIGLKKAVDIVFTMNTAYLTPTSDYPKAVKASIEAVKDLYGENGQEMQSVLEAWKAVGLFLESEDYDLTVSFEESRVNKCADGNIHFVEVDIVNVGIESYAVGDELILRYSIANNLQSEEQVNLQASLNPGDTLRYTFLKGIPLTSGGQRMTLTAELEANAAASLVPELVQVNNRATSSLFTFSFSGIDLDVFSFSLHPESACAETDSILLSIGLENRGCSDILKGMLQVTLETEEAAYNYDIELMSDLSPSGDAFLTRLIETPLDLENGDSISLYLSIANEVDYENNTLESQFFFLESLEEGFIEDFVEFDINSGNEITVNTDFLTDAAITTYNGNEVLAFVGDFGELFVFGNCVEQELLFLLNNNKSRMEMCVNAVGLERPVFSFDLIQFREDIILDNIDESLRVMVKVIIDEEERDIIFDQEEGLAITHEYVLPPDFSGPVVIEIVTLRGVGINLEDEEYAIGDYALFDNFSLSGGTVSTLDIGQERDVTVFPNPSRGLFTFQSESAERFDLLIYDNIGRLISRMDKTIGQASWDSQSVSEGVYFYEIVFEDGGRRQGKLVVGGR